MRPATGIAIALGLGLGLAACNDNNGSPDRTVAYIAKQEISENTSETSDPIMVNDLDLASQDTTETAVPSTL